MGHFRRPLALGGLHQLPSTQVVFERFQVLDCSDDGGFLPLCHLASDRGLENVWFPIRKRRFHDDLYVRSFRVRSYLFIPRADNGTGAPAGWNWILSL